MSAGVADMRRAYERAAAMYRAGRENAVLNERIEPIWCAGSSDFCFALETWREDGARKREYKRFHRESGELLPLFDNSMLSAALERDLGISRLEGCPSIEVTAVDDALHTITLTLIGYGSMVYDAAAGRLRKNGAPRPRPGEDLSPDGRYAVSYLEHDLYLRDTATDEIRRITFDGAAGRDYGVMTPVNVSEYLKEAAPPLRPVVSWSPDSSRFITFMSDTSKMERVAFTRSEPIDPEGSRRPVSFSMPYPMAGDEHIYTGAAYICDVARAAVTPATLLGEALSLNFASMFGLMKTKWTPDSKTAYFMRSDRFFKKFECVLVDAAMGKANIAVTDEYDTFGFADSYDGATYHGSDDFSLEYDYETNEVIWRSETEGRSAFYLYDAATGALKRRLTDPSYSARSIKYIDKKNRVLYFTASGMYEGVDPYFQFLCAVPLDGGDMRVISRERAEHFIAFSPTGDYYIDTFSTVGTAPRAYVRDVDGRDLAFISEADVSRAVEAGFTYPEPFEALARDGKTKLYGILVKPRGFDPAKKYPVIDYIYGGSSHINVPKAFAFADEHITDPLCGLCSLAQLGFIGVIIDGLATPLRTKAIHDMVYGNCGECCGLADHVSAIQELARRYPFVDAERVGIWGFSGGGYAAARALLEFPDFYKAGVSVCGNHDPSTYRADYMERYMGPYDRAKYDAGANRALAKNLRGRLLLIQGDMDVNVHYSSTLGLVAALIRENKDFDMLIVPNAGHILGFLPYVVKKRWDYFVRYLLNEEPPREFDLLGE